jgi:hypothetical protein
MSLLAGHMAGAYCYFHMVKAGALNMNTLQGADRGSWGYIPTLSRVMFGCVAVFQTYSSGASVWVITTLECCGSSRILLTCSKRHDRQHALGTCCCCCRHWHRYRVQPRAMTTF